MITRLGIAGMTSVHCVRAVFTALSGVEGIVSADVSIGRASVEHDTPVPVLRLREAVALAGYEVVEVEESRRGLVVLERGDEG